MPKSGLPAVSRVFVAKKNANGEGSRRHKRRDGRWEDWCWSEGGRRSVYENPRKEIANRLAETLFGKDGAVPAFVPSHVTVAEFLTQYEDVARGTMKRSSFETYQSIAKFHILPESSRT